MVQAQEKYRYEMEYITRTLHGFPELGGQEFKSSQLIQEILLKNGFQVKNNIAGFETAFRGDFASGKSAPRIAFIVEYDALPEIGHGCGHNASAAVSVAAALITIDCMRAFGLEGSIVILGTPAEETLSCKVDMGIQNVFADIDLAMMVHAYDRWEIDCRSMALDAITFKFKGKAAHAAAAPEMGINALDAVMLTFHGINCLREHVLDSCRIHGVVSKGGSAPNVVPETGEANFYVRAQERTYLTELTKRVENCGRGAAIATGCQMVVDNFEPSIDNLKANHSLQDVFYNNLLEVAPGKDIGRDPLWIGSTDVGNLSQLVPSIHPMMALVPEGIELHTKSFADATITNHALKIISDTAYALSGSALELLINSDTFNKVKIDFQE